MTRRALKSDAELGGWRIRGLGDEDNALHIGVMPGRKSVCLYAVRGSVMWPLAYFRNRKCAEHAMFLLDHAFGVLPERGQEWNTRRSAR